MAVSETAKLIVDLSLKGNFARQMGASTKALDKFAAGESRAFKAGAQIGTGIRNAGKLAAVGIGILTSQVALGLDSLIKLEKATAQTEAVIKSTGGAAGLTAAQVGALSEKFENLNATVGDEFIQAGQNMLLTFTKIKGKAFEPALQAILDLNTAMGKGPEGLTSTAIQVGKALNDPTTGLTALRRVGVSFTAAQVSKIKSLQKEGKLYEAQKVILKELNKEFGGSFAAQGGTTAAKVAKFTDSVDDLQRSLATALLPTVSNVADALSEFLADPQVVKGAEDLGVEIGKLFSKQNIGQGIEALKGFFSFAREVAPVVGAAAKATAGFITTAVRAFQTLPPEIQGLLAGGFALNKLTGGLVTNIGGGLIGAVLRQLKSAVVTVHGGVVNVSGAGGLPGAVGKGGGLLGALSAIAVPALAVTAVAGAAKLIQDNIDEQGAAVLKQAQGFAPKATDAELARSIDGLRKQVESMPFNTFDSKNKVVATLNTLIAEQNRRATSTTPTSSQARAGMPEVRQWHYDNGKKVTLAVENLRRDIGPSLSKTPVKLDKVATNTVAAGVAAKNASMEVKTSTIEAGVKAKNAAMETKATVASGTMIQAALMGSQIATTMTSAFGTQGAVRSVAPPIVGAIRANRPITTVTVNVTATHVTKSTTVQNRYGPGGGSGSQNARPGDSGV